jgi:hypothetical protein
MKALPVKFYDKKLRKKVQAFEVDFDLCYDPENKVVECAFIGYSSEHCSCSTARRHCKVSNSVIFLETKE